MYLPMIRCSRGIGALSYALGTSVPMHTDGIPPLELWRACLRVRRASSAESQRSWE